MRRIDTDLFGSKESSINSKRKGNANELMASKWLLKWTGCPFTRTPSSGGLRWKSTANVCGDVVCEVSDFVFPFSVETKHLKSVYVTKALRSNSEIFTIFVQAVEDANRAGKLPLCLIRSNGMKSGSYYVVLAGWIGEWLSICCKCVGKGIKDLGGIIHTIYVFDSDEVLEKIPYQKLLEFYKQKSNRNE